MKFILYALIAFLVVQMIRTTMRIKTNARKWDDSEDQEKPRPPVVNIPDIEDANFEDISDQPEGEEKKPGDGPPTSAGDPSPSR